MKKKRLFGILLSLALMLTMMPTLSLPAFATSGQSLPVTPENSGTATVNYEDPGWRLTATPEEGWEFDKWTYTIGGTSYETTANPFDTNDFISFDKDSVTAHFKQAAVGYGVWVGNEQVTDKHTSGTGWSYDAKTKTLTLDGATLETTYHVLEDEEEEESAVIYSENELNIVVKGENTVKNTCTESVLYNNGIYCTKDLTISGTGSLTFLKGTSNEYSIYTRKGNLTINNAAVTVRSDYYGIYANRDLTINQAPVTISSGGYALYANGDITVNSSTINAEGKKQGIEADGKITITDSEVDARGNSEEGICVDDYPLEINNSQVQVSSVQDEAIYAETDVIMNSGRLEAKSQSQSQYDGGIYVDDGKFIMNGGVVVATGVYGVYADEYSVYFNGGEATLIGTKQGVYAYRNVVLSDRATVKAGENEEDAKDVTSTFAKEHDQKWVHVVVTPDPEPAPIDPTAVGTIHEVPSSVGMYVVTAADTVSLAKAPSKKSYTLPATVTINGKVFNVTGINAKAFKGTKVRTLTVKTKGLTKASVKGSLKGSKVKTVKVKVGKKKTNKKYVKKYKKYFTKKNCGKKVRVRR